jgi:hypothetical protein
MHHEIGTSQSHNNLRDKNCSQDTELEPPHMEVATFFSLGFSYTLPKTNYDSYARQKTKFTSPENCRLASPLRHCPLQVVQTEYKKRQLSSVRIRGTNHYWPLNQSSIPK